MFDKIYKQPNGKYCMMSPYCGGGVNQNLSEQDIIDRYIEEAKRKAENDIREAKNFGNIIEDIRPDYFAKGIKVDDVLKEMGFEKPYNELIKYVPKKPLHQEYHDFTTYGTCPNCKEQVSICMESGIKKCKCGQMLDWGD